MQKLILCGCAIAVMVGVTSVARADEAKSEAELKTLFSEYYEAKNLDGLLGLFYSEGAQENVVGFVEQVLNRHLARGYPIGNLSIMEMPDDVAKAIERTLTLQEEIQKPTLKPEKLFTATFRGDSTLTTFQAPVGIKDGVYYFVLSSPRIP